MLSMNKADCVAKETYLQIHHIATTPLSIAASISCGTKKIMASSLARVRLGIAMDWLRRCHKVEQETKLLLSM